MSPEDNENLIKLDKTTRRILGRTNPDKNSRYEDDEIPALFDTTGRILESILGAVNRVLVHEKTHKIVSEGGRILGAILALRTRVEDFAHETLAKKEEKE